MESVAIVVVILTSPKLVTVALPCTSPVNVIAKSAVSKLSRADESSYVTVMPFSVLTGDTMLPTISWICSSECILGKLTFTSVLSPGAAVTLTDPSVNATPVKLITSTAVANPTTEPCRWTLILAKFCEFSNREVAEL